MAGLYKEEPQGEGQPSIWDEEFKVGRQSYPVTSRDEGMLREHGGQVGFHMLNRNPS